MEPCYTFKSPYEFLNYINQKYSFIYMQFSVCSSPEVSSITWPVTHLASMDPLYHNNQRCTWIIAAPENQIIKFWLKKFDSFQLGDFLEVRDGTGVDAMLVKNFTTKQNPQEPWATSGRFLWIRFDTKAHYIVNSDYLIQWKFYNKTQGIMNYVNTSKFEKESIR